MRRSITFPRVLVGSRRSRLPGVSEKMEKWWLRLSVAGGRLSGFIRSRWPGCKRIERNIGEVAVEVGKAGGRGDAAQSPFCKVEANNITV